MRDLQDDHAQVQWVSWIELLLLYQMQTGQCGVICKGRGHKRQWEALNIAQSPGFRKMAASMAQYSQNIVRLSLPDFRAVQRRPGNFRLHLAVNCVPVRISPQFQANVDCYLDSLQLGSIHQSPQLENIKVAL